MVNLRRTRILHEGSGHSGGPVLYWMSRDQRAKDNWALLYASELALEKKSPLGVVFCLVTKYLGANPAHFRFMLAGLKEVEASLKEKNIPLFLLQGEPGEEIPRFVKTLRASALVTDFNPLRINRQWKERVCKSTDAAVYEVDAHNIVPCWIASPKREFGAYTIRPKINRLLPEFLEAFPKLEPHAPRWKEKTNPVLWNEIERGIKNTDISQDLSWIKPGEDAAAQRLRQFIETGLSAYDVKRNDPSDDGQSGLSPYFHFGQLSAQRAALEVSKTKEGESRSAYLEELIIRRELSDNFCYFNPQYDSFDGFPDWAKKTLNDHRKDKREFLYTLEQFERAETHDPLWNAAQIEMTSRGKMHGYMRMYWAKKILEWSGTPEAALETAISLNDRYELDGRDPNGYAGIAWCIGGVHDRPWFDRKIFGLVRFMSRSGLEKKFDTKRYIKKYLTKAQKELL